QGHGRAATPADPPTAGATGAGNAGAPGRHSGMGYPVLMTLAHLHRPLGNTGLQVSPLGLGTVKIGRNQGVKYPSGLDLPDDGQARDLLAQASELGINLTPTAPGYVTIA